MVRIHIPTHPDERALAAAGVRDRTAEHNSLRPLLAPASLAVIGVSRSQRGVGYEILQAVLGGEFTGRTYPVNPHAKTIDGLDLDTLFRQAGVLRMDTLGELLDAAQLLTEQPLPAGDRVAIIGNAGGLNVLAADAAAAAGLQVVELSATLQHEFADLAPHLAGVMNPLDLGADAPPATIGRAIRAFGSSGEADALVVTLVATRANDLPGAARRSGRGG